jgi:hypothetical protein
VNIVSGFFSSFRRHQGDEYDLLKLVDQRVLEEKVSGSGNQQVICDIDKTYLETEFESFVKMARIPFEGAKDKITVRGATEVLQAYRWGDPAVGDNPLGVFPQPLHFVSSSPPQLRSVLEQKLALDGLDWSSDTFKNQAYNLKKGRFDQLRQQAAYKSAAILSILHRVKPGSSILFIGDNAESDAFVYLGIKLLVEGKLSPLGYQKYIELAGVEERVAKTLADLAGRKIECLVSGILIRDLPGSKFCLHDPVTRPVRLFSDFFEVAVFMMGLGYIEGSALWNLIRVFHNRHGISLERVISLLSQARLFHTQPTYFIGIIDELLEKLAVYIKPIDVQDIQGKPSPCFEKRADSELLDEKVILQQCADWMRALQADKNS